MVVAMSVLCPTPRERMLDARGRPYFLWDTDMTLARFEELLREGEQEVRVHLVAKLMRQAKSDDGLHLRTARRDSRPLAEDRATSWDARATSGPGGWNAGKSSRMSSGLSPLQERVLAAAGTSMHRPQAISGGESTVIDLVAEPVPTIEEPVERPLGDVTIRVDTEHEILVNKLCALVQRSELRDLSVHALLTSGGDLTRALEDAPEKDGGFSPLTLAWLLKELSIEPVGRAEGWPPDQVAALEEFRDSLLERLGNLSRPETD